MPDKAALLGIALLTLLYPTWALRSWMPTPRWVAPMTYLALGLCAAGLVMLHLK